MAGRLAGVVAVVCLAGAYAWFAQGEGAGQNAHYALVRALAQATPTIDETRLELGNVVTHDVVEVDGHVYSNKAPGLAMATVPVYLVLERAGVRTTGDPTRVLWALGLVGTVLPAMLLLLLVARLAERLEPGYGTATAVALGAGTLLLPYGTVFFAHALSALLGFAAFAVLWRERDGPSGLVRVAAAGLLVGLAVTTEYPTAIVALVLGALVLARPPRLWRAAAYAGGALVGLLPLLTYNWWAFGSPTRLSYGGADVLSPGGTPGAEDDRFFGVGVPSARVAVELLFSHWGLLQVAPVLAAGVLGAIVAFRRGHRAEMLVAGAVAVLFLAYNAGFWGPQGGTAGTRYLIPMVPFLALPVAVAFRIAPAATAALATVSIALMVGMTATGPISAWDGGVLRRLTSADGSASTVSDFLGVTGWYAVVPFYVLVAAAVASALVATPWSPTRANLVAGAAALSAWALVALAAPALLTNRELDRTASTALVLLLVTGVASAVVLAGRRPAPAR